MIATQVRCDRLSVPPGDMTAITKPKKWFTVDIRGDAL